MKNKVTSILIIAVIYVLATIVGVITFNNLDFDWIINLLIADVVATIVVFIFSLVFKNASVYDPYWSVQPIVILALLVDEVNLTVILTLAVVFLWAVRLTANWAYTFKNMYHQDWRYTMLKEKTKKFYPVINFLGIHLVPTLIVYGCTLPAVYLVVSAHQPGIGLAFYLISLLAVILQLVSDIQMHKYRKNRTTPFIRNGLWKYSRHPNYLGEILMWWGVALVALALTDMWLAIGGAVLNTLLFLFVSIPMADKRQSQKEGFLDYKKQTRMLLPLKKIIAD